MSQQRKIAVVTVARSDFGIYRPILKRIADDPDLSLQLMVTGTHLASAYGRTIEEIEADGFVPAATIPCVLDSDTPDAVSKSMGLQIVGFAEALTRLQPDLLVVLGDRFEMLAAAVSTLPFNIPLAHIHGGELSLGAIDDAMRHALTKLSHIHFPATRDYANRLLQLGEDPARVFAAGAPSLDNLHTSGFESVDLAQELALDPALFESPVLVTFHAETRSSQSGGEQVTPLLAALEKVGGPVIFTMPNNDPGGLEIAERMRAFCDGRTDRVLVSNLGSRRYFKAMSIARAMVGNSSSGIIESASFGLPVLNIGERQLGRAESGNVVHVENTPSAVAAGLENVLAAARENRFKGIENVYGDGTASAKIVQTLKTVEIDRALLQKPFVDLGASPEALTA